MKTIVIKCMMLVLSLGILCNVADAQTTKKRSVKKRTTAKKTTAAKSNADCYTHDS